MKVLFLDLASNSGTIALAQEDAVVSIRDLDHRVSDADLVPLYENILRDTHITPSELTHLACVTGPGGFTSLRSGVAFINTLAFALGIPSTGIHLSDVYRARDASRESTWLHSTRRTALFFRSPTDAEASLIEADQLVAHVQNAHTWMGELIPEHQQLIAPLRLAKANLAPLQEILPNMLVAQQYAKNTILPWYGRGW